MLSEILSDLSEGNPLPFREIEVISDGEREGHGEEDNLANYSEASLKEVVQCAGLTHIDHVLRPILT